MTRVSKNSNHAKLEKYHPVRFYLMRDDDLWFEVVEAHAAAIKEDRNMAVLGVAERLYYLHCDGTNLLKGLEEYAYPKERLEKAFSDDFGGASGAIETAVMGWHNAGKQIFDLSAIAAMFQESDALKMPIGQLKLPYESFFIHWGKHLEMPSPMNSRFIEGCYISREDSLIYFTFVTSLPEGDPWDKRSLLANLVVDCEGICAMGIDTEAGGVLSEEFIKRMDIGWAPEAEIDRWQKYIKTALNMAANCMCYLTSPKAEIEESYPLDAPERLVKQASFGTPRERVRAESKLMNLGFRMVRLCGRHLSEALGIKPGAKDMPAHWRRGHWWPAHFGKGRTEVRMTWRDGVVVNANKGSPDVGHLYKS